MITDFTTLNLPAKLLQSLTRMKFTTPTPIQAQAIPLALEGKDILGSAQTGTGKTGAFGIPLIARLLEAPQATAIVLTPTRELASQVLESLTQMIPTGDIRTALLIGGESMQKQLRQLQNRPRLIVGTPGRVNDHLLRKSLNLKNCGFLVLDETDRMLDMGFGVQIDKIVSFLPESRQTMLFSATLAPAIVKIANKYTKSPERISVGSTVQVAPKVRQEMIQLSEDKKYDELLAQLELNNGSAIVFVKTKFGTERLAKRLCGMQYRADALHGDLRQSRRDRVVQDFRDRKFRILVATDVAARGLDVPHIEVVVNYDLPQAPEDYIHRVGRTARAGASGVAINLVTPADRGKWSAINRLMNPGAANEPRERDENRGGKKPGARRPNGNGGGKKFAPRSNGGTNHRGQRDNANGGKPNNGQQRREGANQNAQRREGGNGSGYGAKNQAGRGGNSRGRSY